MITIIGTYSLTVLIILMVSILLYGLWTQAFPNKLACKIFGWHQARGKLLFDGCSVHGKCVACGKSVMQDSQGNWF